MKGVSPGAALVFLMAGPATNVATMTVIGKTMGRKSLMVYLASIIGGAIVFGMLMNWFVPVGFILSKMAHVHGDATHEMLPQWLGIASALFLLAAIISGYFIERIQKNKKMELEKFQTIRVDGMTCSHCEAAINRHVAKLEGVEEVVADRNTAQVKIKGSVDLKKVEEMVTELGYQYKGVI
jgi:hypothetical protein